MEQAITRLEQRERPARGLVAAAASGILPGLGQLFNGESSKALGVFLLWVVTTASVIRWIPLIGTLGAVVGGCTWVYAVVDGYLTGKRK